MAINPIVFVQYINEVRFVGVAAGKQRLDIIDVSFSSRAICVDEDLDRSRS
jgi:hypothetical protein